MVFVCEQEKSIGSAADARETRISSGELFALRHQVGKERSAEATAGLVLCQCGQIQGGERRGVLVHLAADAKHLLQFDGQVQLTVAGVPLQLGGGALLLKGTTRTEVVLVGGITAAGGGGLTEEVFLLFAGPAVEQCTLVEFLGAAQDEHVLLEALSSAALVELREHIRPRACLEAARLRGGGEEVATRHDKPRGGVNVVRQNVL
mmetsp:Transcript_2428/g.5745  ORF Transcript_2428/g.5745 Transcript_2428/m.5745 type:complete len:205 (-) Transcript_2428:319-933(-)